ncbi:hypothetical protein V8E54_005321 [Elaphomyces granulatus]|jgi:hypothetical protein
MASSRDSLQLSQLDFHDFYTRDLQKLFDASATPSQLRLPLRKSQGTAALGDPSTLKELLQPVLGDDIKISLFDGTISSTQCSVEYQVEQFTNSDRTRRMIVSFTRCLDSRAAKESMKGQMCSYDIDISKVARRANIGSHSLRMAGGVFWVRDTIFTDVYTSGDVFTDSIDNVAQTIDKYLSEHTTKPKKPQVHLLTDNPMKDKVRERFTIKLADQEDLHKIKGFKIEDPSLVLPTANRDDIGEFPCTALKAGKTKIRLEVAHAKSLAVAFQDVTITINDQTQLPPPPHPSEEDWNRQPDKSEMSLKQATPKHHVTRMATGSLPPSKKCKTDDDNNDLRRGSGREKRLMRRKLRS